MTTPLRFIQIGTGGWGHYWCTEVLPRLIRAGKVTPAAVVDQLGQWCSTAMLAPELKPRWALQGLEPVGKPGAVVAAHLRQQQDEYGRVIREASIQAE